MSVSELEAYCDYDSNYIFNNTSDRLSYRSKITHSLMLIKPEFISFEKKIIGFKTQIRAHFLYKWQNYDLVITDSKFEKRFKSNDAGFYTINEKYYLTISLGEKYRGYHFKLVAAVIPIE